MTEAVPSRAAALAALTAPGAEYEVEQQIVNGKSCRVLRNAPASLRALLEHTRQFAEFDHLVYQDEHLSYAQTYSQVAAIASTLVTDYGVSKGDRVAIAMRNYPEWITSFLAITAIGGIAVAVNALWNTEELAYSLELTDCKLLIADRERIERLSSKLDTMDLHILSVRCDDVQSSARIKPLLTAQATPVVDIPPVDLQPDDDAFIFFTSGSTGHPKGVVSSHRAAIHAVMSWDLDLACSLWRGDVERPNEPWDLRFRFLLAVPLFHVTGSHVGMLSTLYRGREVHLTYKWDVDQALDIIEREQISHFIAVPTMTGDLVRAAAEQQRSLASLMAVGGGGAPRSSQQVREIGQVFANAAPTTGWGMTETNAIGAAIAGEDYLQRPLSSGQMSVVYDARIVNDSDQEIATGEAGHLLIRGTSMFREYWNRPEANAEAFVDGWFRTGDIARFDAEGFLYIVDRAKDIVIRGGENIGCGEVEDAIYGHLAVSEVVVFGLPHERLGEEVATVIVLKDGWQLEESVLLDHLRQQLAAFQVPSRIIFRASPLPRIASGKFDKRGVRSQLVKSLGLVAE